MGRLPSTQFNATIHLPTGNASLSFASFTSSWTIYFSQRERQWKITLKQDILFVVRLVFEFHSLQFHLPRLPVTLDSRSSSSLASYVLQTISLLSLRGSTLSDNRTVHPVRLQQTTRSLATGTPDARFSFVTYLYSYYRYRQSHPVKYKRFHYSLQRIFVFSGRPMHVLRTRVLLILLYVRTGTVRPLGRTGNYKKYVIVFCNFPEDRV